MKNENNGTIKLGYINPKYRKPKRKLNLKLIGKGVATIGAAIIVGVTGSTMVQFFKNLYKPKPINIPNEKASITFNIELQEGDTVSSVASKYYFDDTEEAYGSFSNYTKSIEQQNRRDIDSVGAGEIVQIPVVVDKDNPYYMELVNIQKQIKDIENNNLWVMHKVEYGERMSTIAQLASGSYEETQKFVSQICSKNNISNPSLINEGDEIWILNPELGKLKHQLNETMEQLRLSLEHSQVKK